jgi:hypothetical protein
MEVNGVAASFSNPHDTSSNAPDPTALFEVAQWLLISRGVLTRQVPDTSAIDVNRYSVSVIGIRRLWP